MSFQQIHDLQTMHQGKMCRRTCAITTGFLSKQGALSIAPKAPRQVLKPFFAANDAGIHTCCVELIVVIVGNAVIDLGQVLKIKRRFHQGCTVQFC
jgi:hypothetical protein